MRALRRVVCAAMLAALLAGVFVSCSDSDDDGPSLPQEVLGYEEGRAVLRIKFFEDKTWRAWVDAGHGFGELERGTFTGNPTTAGTVTMKVTQWGGDGDNGNWHEAPQGYPTLGLQLVASGSNLIVDNLDETGDWMLGVTTWNGE